MSMGTKIKDNQLHEELGIHDNELKLFRIIESLGSGIREYLQETPGLNINAIHPSKGQTPLQLFLSTFQKREKESRLEDLDAILSYVGLQVDFAGNSLPTPLYSFVQDNSDFVASADNCNLLVVEKLLQRNADVNYVNVNEKTVLMLCLYGKRCMDLINLLFSHDRTDVNVKTQWDNISQAWFNQHQNFTLEDNDNILHLLLKKKLNVKEVVEFRSSFFHHLFKMYHTNYVSIGALQRLIKYEGFDPNQCARENNNNWSPLMTVIDSKLIALVEMLVKHKDININLLDNINGRTALMYSTCDEIDEILLSCKTIDLHIISKNGMTALRQFLEERYDKYKCKNEFVCPQQRIQRIFTHAKYNVNKVHDDGKTDLMWACIKDQGITDDLLTHKKIDVTVKDPHGRNILFHAANVWGLHSMKAVLNHSTVPPDKRTFLNNQDDYGETFVHVFLQNAAKESHNIMGVGIPKPVTLVRQLYNDDLSTLRRILHECDINIQDNKGYTPIMRAIENSSKNPLIADIVVILLEHPRGCDLYKMNHYKQDVQILLQSGLDNNTLSDKVHSLISDALGQTSAHKSYGSLSLEEQLKIMLSSVVSKESKLNREQQEHLKFLLNVVDETLNSFNKGAYIDVDNEHRKKIMDKYCYLIDQLEVKEVSDQLFQDRVLTEHEYQKIHQKETRHERVTYFLSILLIRDKQGYDSFINALEKSSQGFIAKEINRPKECTDVVVKDFAQVYGTNVFRLDIPQDRKLSSLTFQMTALND